MTEQEAIGYLKTLPNRIPLKFFTDDGAKVYDEFSQVATSALEKQIPKKPAYDGDGYAPDGTFVWDEWLCPCCGTRYEVDYDEYDFCPNCGQAIDWSENE